MKTATFVLGAAFSLLVAGQEFDEEDEMMNAPPFDMGEEGFGGEGDGGEDEDNMDMPMPPSFDKIEEPVHKAVDLQTKPFLAPSKPASALFHDTFQHTEGFGSWVPSSNSKFTGVWKVEGRKEPSILGDSALKVTTANAYHGIATKLESGLPSNEGKDLYASFEVEFENEVNCGGAYFKMFDSSNLEDPKDVATFNNETPYVIMFGPDKCGMATNKVHLIIKWKNEKTGEWTESHLKNPPKFPAGKGIAHQYGFAIKSDDTYELYIDGKVESTGAMKDSFSPSFASAATIADDKDVKPDDWVDEKKIPDAGAVKPEDWDESAPEMIEDADAVMPEGWKVDEPMMIVNKDATKPDDWIEEEDGVWTAPMMKNPDCYVGCGEWQKPMKQNPEYKGVWKAPMIANPAYKGPWKARDIPNPNFFEVTHPHTLHVMNAVGFELWTVETGAIFDNMLVTHDKQSFDKFIEETFKAKHDIEENNVEARKQANMKKMAESIHTNIPAWQRALIAVQQYAVEKPLNIVMSALVPLIAVIYMMTRSRQSVKVVPEEAAAKKDDAKKDDSKKDGKKDDKKDKDEKKDDKKDDKKDEKKDDKKDKKDAKDETLRKRKGSAEKEKSDD